MGISATHVRTHHDNIPRLCRAGSDVAGGAVVTSVGNGQFSDPTTWGGSVPGANARIIIEHEVTYNQNSNVAYQCIEVRDNAKLHFPVNQTTKLRLHGELLVMPFGALTIGTAAAPVQASVQHEILFTDAPLQIGTLANPGPDPSQYGKGILVFGDITVHGHKLDRTFLRFAEEPSAGDTVLKLETAPAGWQTGDTLLIPDTRQIPFVSDSVSTPSNAEEVVIASIDGPNVTLSSALAYDHHGPRDVTGNQGPIEKAMLPHVGSLSRNVVFRSETSDEVPLRAHVAFFNRAQVNIKYASFIGLGRTTVAALDDSTFDESGTLTKIGTNAKGRYSAHFHHVVGPRNPSNAGYQGQLVGNLFLGESAGGAPKWMITVHNTHYSLIKDNLLYDGAGSAFATEDGNEAYNVIERNFVVHLKSGAPRRALQGVGRGGVFNGRDLFGTTKDAFWFSGQYNYVRDNVAANTPAFAYNYNGYYLTNTMRVPRFRGADMNNPAEYEEWNFHQSANKATTPDFKREGLPVLESARNETYASGQALWLTWARGCCSVSYYKEVSLFKDYTMWHIQHTGVYAFHENRNTFDGIIMRNDPNVSVRSGPNSRFNRGYWMGTSTYENGRVIIKNTDVQGFNIGVAMPPNTQDGDTEPDVVILEDSVLKNHINIQEFLINSALVRKDSVYRNVKMTPVPSYNSNVLPLEALNIWMDPGTDGKTPNKPVRAFAFDYNGVPGSHYQIYFVEQAPDEVFAACPEAGLTNRQCWDTYGRAFAGAVAPCVGKVGDANSGANSCNAAKDRAQALKIVGLPFAMATDEIPPIELPTAPPSLFIRIETALDRTLIQTWFNPLGDLAGYGARKIIFEIDDVPRTTINLGINPVPGGTIKKVVYGISQGEHTFRAYLAREDDSVINGTEVVGTFVGGSGDTTDDNSGFATDEPSAKIHVLRPYDTVSLAGSTLSVVYRSTGNLSAANVDHAHFVLDGNEASPVEDVDFDGNLVIPNLSFGIHTIQAYLVGADDQEIPNSRSSTITFTLTDEVTDSLKPSAPTNLRIGD